MTDRYDKFRNGVKNVSSGRRDHSDKKTANGIRITPYGVEYLSFMGISYAKVLSHYREHRDVDELCKEYNLIEGADFEIQISSIRRVTGNEWVKGAVY